MSNDTIQMAGMAVLARPMVDLNFNGWQIAYQRSTEINVSVSTETETETVWNEKINDEWLIGLGDSVRLSTKVCTQ